VSGLCGWLGLKASSPEAVLNAMTGGLWADGTGAVASRTDPLAALAVETGHDGGVLHSDGSMRAAIVGQPYWSDPALSAMAKQVNNAAALLTGFRRHGTDVLRFVHGAFALAVVDTQAGDALLAIDRFGIHPLCYAQVGSGLVFGTRTDAVRAHPNVASTISPQAIFDYLNFSIVPAQHTIFREQSKLLPAQFVHFKNGTPKTSFYWARGAGRGVARPAAPSGATRGGRRRHQRDRCVLERRARQLDGRRPAR
jgi:asparagine synthase (glutamine-hydrolysing)